jgi:hypothetical protein
MAEKSIWKIWLVRNTLTKEIENDWVAEVSILRNTLRNEDIAARIVEGRSELQLETIKGILSERDEIVKQALVQGTAVQDGCIRASPRISVMGEKGCSPVPSRYNSFTDHTLARSLPSTPHLSPTTFL